MRTAVTAATGHASVRTRQQDLTERIPCSGSFSVYQMTVEQAQELVRGEPGSGNLAWHARTHAHVCAHARAHTHDDGLGVCCKAREQKERPSVCFKDARIYTQKHTRIYTLCMQGCVSLTQRCAVNRTKPPRVNFS